MPRVEALADRGLQSLLCASIPLVEVVELSGVVLVGDDDSAYYLGSKACYLVATVSVDHGPDIYQVYSEEGTEYLVDIRTPSCTCPDFMYREADCKHIRRARIEAGKRDLNSLNEDIQTPLDTLNDHIANLAAQRAELVGLQRDLDQFRQAAEA